MKLSLFTPSHNPQYLSEVYRSILLQADPSWEWVILRNGAFAGELPAALVADPRVRILSAPTEAGSRIGALKRAACRAASGDVLIELDHDDLLVPGTLHRIRQAASQGPGFLYSDAAVFEQKDLRSWAYWSSHHWESYPINVYGRQFTVTEAFDVTARSLCEVHYAPDHVRCWTRDAYWKSGGHSADLAVGDDHELICRTYLAGIPFRHIGGCGYLYRVHKENTVRSNYKEIRKVSQATKARYLRPLIAEWCRRQRHASLSLQDLLSRGWTVEQDAFHGLGVPDNSLGSFFADDCLQFVEGWALPHLFNAVYRALVPGGWFQFSVPNSEQGLVGLHHPKTRTHFNRHSWQFYCHAKTAQQLPEADCRYQLVQQRNGVLRPFAGPYDTPYLIVELSALKGQRQPGVTEI